MIYISLKNCFTLQWPVMCVKIYIIIIFSVIIYNNNIIEHMLCFSIIYSLRLYICYLHYYVEHSVFWKTTVLQKCDYEIRFPGFFRKNIFSAFICSEILWRPKFINYLCGILPCSGIMYFQ